jgi:hypothetical protein
MSPRKLLLTVDRSVNAVAFPFSAEVRTATTHFFADPYAPKIQTYVLGVLYSRMVRIAIGLSNVFSHFPQFQCSTQIFQMHLFSLCNCIIAEYRTIKTYTFCTQKKP